MTSCMDPIPKRCIDPCQTDEASAEGTWPVASIASLQQRADGPSRRCQVDGQDQNVATQAAQLVGSNLRRRHSRHWQGRD